MEPSDYIIYVDESGDHGLSSIDERYPVFVLAACIIRKDQLANEIAPLIQEFKFKWWGHDLVVLHEREIRKQKPPYAFLTNMSRRTEFMGDLAAIIKNAPFVVVAAVIDKIALKRQYAFPASPYDIALCFIVERCFAFLKDQGQEDNKTHFIVEKRGAKEDNDLELAFRRICDGDNYWGTINSMNIEFAEKIKNLTGLQLADLVARPIGLNFMRPNQSNYAFDIIDEKLRTSPAGKKMGWGLKIFP